jgi:hypothetical protein
MYVAAANGGPTLGGDEGQAVLVLRSTHAPA